MAATFTFPADQQARLSHALRTMAAVAQQDAVQVVRGFAGIVLKSWAGRTKVSTVQRVTIGERVRILRDLGFTGGKRNADATISISAGRRGPFGRVWLRKKDGHGWRRTHNADFQPLNQHYKKGQWIDLQEAISDYHIQEQRRLPRALRSIGLARQSVIQIADALGIDLATVRGGGSLSAAGIAKARRAIATNGNVYVNGTGREERQAEQFFLTLINSYPPAEKLRMDATLAGVLSGQIKYFQRNCEEGVFLSLARTARAYPFLDVKAA